MLCGTDGYNPTCSTPEGDTDFDTIAAGEGMIALYVCSTPEGDTDFDTWYRP